MNKLLLCGVFLFFLSGCVSDNKIPDMSFKGTVAEDLVNKPDRELLQKLPPRQYLSPGMNNGQVGVIISNNNLRAATTERRLEDLQQYVCNIFKDPVGEVCSKDK